MGRQAITALCSGLLMACCWFCLWVVSYYFVLDYEQAVLFLPFALRLGVSLHSPRRLWPVIYLTELLLLIVLAILLGQQPWLLVISASMASIPVLWLASEYYSGSQWRRLWVMAALIGMTSLISACMVAIRDNAFWLSLLTGIAGGLMVVPACHLVWHYLFRTARQPLTATLARRPIRFHGGKLLLYSLLLLGNIAIQQGLPEQMRRFAPFCLVVPIIFLAFRYG